MLYTAKKKKYRHLRGKLAPPCGAAVTHDVYCALLQILVSGRRAKLPCGIRVIGRIHDRPWDRQITEKLNTIIIEDQVILKLNISGVISAGDHEMLITSNYYYTIANSFMANFWCVSFGRPEAVTTIIL